MATHIEQSYKRYIPSGSSFELVDGTSNIRAKTVYTPSVGPSPVIGDTDWTHPNRSWSTTLLYVSSIETLTELSNIYTIDQESSGTNFSGGIAVNRVIEGSETFTISSGAPLNFTLDFNADSSLNGTLTSIGSPSGTFDYDTGDWTLNMINTAISSGFISATFISIAGENLDGLSAMYWDSPTPVTAISASVIYFGNDYVLGTHGIPVTSYEGGVTYEYNGLSGSGYQLSGGIEFLNFHYDCPGIKTITACLVDAPIPTTLDCATLDFNIHEASGVVVSQASNTDHWEFSVSASEWYNKSFAPNDILSWTTYGNQGFVSADYVGSTEYYNSSGLTTDLTGPTGLVSDGDIDYINFHYNAPGVKTVKASKIDPDSGDQLISTNVSLVTLTGYNNGIPANGISALSVDLPTLSSTNFYSSALNIFIDSSDIIARTIDITLFGSYGSTYGSEQLFVIDGNRNIEWSVDTFTGLGITGADDTIYTSSPFSGSYYTLSSLSLSSTTQNVYTLTANYLGDTNTFDIFEWQVAFEPENLKIDYEFSNCPRVRSLTATAKTVVDGTEYDVLGNFEIAWTTPNNDTTWTATNVNGNPYTLGVLNPAKDIGTIVLETEPIDDSTPMTLTSDIRVEYPTTSVSVVSTIYYDEFPSNDIFDLDFIMNRELASHSSYTDVWRVSSASSPWTPTTYTADLSALMNDVVPSAGTYTWTFDDSSATGYTTTKVFDTTVLPTVCSISLAASCVTEPGFLYPHSKEVSLNMHFVSGLSTPSVFIYPQNSWYSKAYEFVDNVDISLRFADPLSAYGEIDTPTFWLSASNNGVVGESNVWWLSGRSDNDFKATGGKASWTVPFTYPAVTPNYSISALLGVFDSTTSENMVSTYFDDNNGQELLYGNFSQNQIPIYGYESPETTINASNTINDSSVTINASETFTFPGPAAIDIDDGSSNLLWRLSSSNGIVEQLNDGEFTISGSLEFGELYKLQLSANVAEFIPQAFGGGWETSFRTVTTDFIDVYPLSIFFDLCANSPYSLYETGTFALTGFAPLTTTAVLSTTFSPGFTGSWVVGQDSYTMTTDQTLAPWVCTYTPTTTPPYRTEDYTTDLTTIVCTVTSSGGDVSSITRDFTTRATVPPFLEVYPVNKYAQVGDDVTFINLSREVLPFVPISGYIWSNGFGSSAVFQDESDFVTSYPLQGTQSVFLSGIDSKNYVFAETFLGVVVILDEFDGLNPDLIRANDEAIVPPNSLNDILMPPNEWVTDDNINKVFEKFDENLDYLKNISSLYDIPPVEYIGWLGKDPDDTSNTWHIKGVDTNFNDISSNQSGFTNALDMSIRSDKLIYVAQETSVKILDNDYAATQLEEIVNTTIGDPFLNIAGIAVNSEDDLYVLDKTNNKVTVFEYDTDDNINPLRMLYNWGGLGGPGARNKYNAPNDIFVKDDTIWITDSGNNTIKKYSSTGNWLDTFMDSHLDAPISTTVDSDGNMHVLTSQYVVKLDSTGTFISTYTYLASGTPRKIRASADEGMIYICLSDKILKITESGLLIGTMGTNDLNDTVDFKSLTHVSNRNMYVANTENVLLYVDYIKIITANINIGTVWDTDGIDVDKREFVQDWVYTRSFHRLWDNLDYLRRGLYGKITTTTVDGLESLTIVPREESEFPTFTYGKEDIFVGTNELVTADVVNRLIRQMHDAQDTLITMLEVE
jgi:hypothetical protein